MIHWAVYASNNLIFVYRIGCVVAVNISLSMDFSAIKLLQIHIERLNDCWPKVNNQYTLYTIFFKVYIKRVYTKTKHQIWMGLPWFFVSVSEFLFEHLKWANLSCCAPNTFNFEMLHLRRSNNNSVLYTKAYLHKMNEFANEYRCNGIPSVQN